MTQMNKPFERARETATIPPSHTTVGILPLPPTNMVQHNPQTSVWLFPRLEATKTMFGCNATVPQGRDPGRPRPSQTNSEDFHGVSDTLNLGKPARQPWRNLGEPWTSFRQPRENFSIDGNASGMWGKLRNRENGTKFAACLKPKALLGNFGRGWNILECLRKSYHRPPLPNSRPQADNANPLTDWKNARCMFAIQTVNCVSDQSSTSTFLILCNLHARKQRNYVELASSEKINSNHESSLRSPPPVAVLTRARSGSGNPGSPAARSVKLSEKLNN